MNRSEHFYRTNNLKVPHVFTTRLGGYSLSPYDSFNLKFPTNDEHETYEAVLKNRKRLVDVMGVDLESLVACQQVHGNHIYQVQQSDQGRGSIHHHEGLPDTDALITDQIGIPLLVMVADCVPILVSDPIQKVVAAIHAGWRGTAKQILSKTLKSMQDDYSCQLENIQVAIGPSIGQCCFEVDEPVVEAFRDLIDINDPLLIQARHSKFFPNLKEINKNQALKTGLFDEQIQIIDLCTYCNKQFYSYRRDRGQTGRLAGVIVLNS